MLLHTRLRRCARVILLGSGLALVLACAGEAPSTRTGADARASIEGVSGRALPASAHSERSDSFVWTDWMTASEAAGPRGDMQEWFDNTSMPCGPGTVQEIQRGPESLGDPAYWQAPTGGTWLQRSCSEPMGADYSIAITREGDPAWIRVNAQSIH